MKVEEELESAEVALFLDERLARSEKRLSAADFLVAIGMGQFVEQVKEPAAVERQSESEGVAQPDCGSGKTHEVAS